MTVTPWNKNDELFASELAKGHAWQLYVAMKLLQRGLVVQCSKLELWRTESGLVGRPPIEDFTKSDVDILVGRDRVIPIEVKSRRFAFRTAKDYPYKDAMVGTVDSWEQTTTRPEVVVLISQKTRAILAVNVADTFSNWTIEENDDGVRGIASERSYCCPLKHLRPFPKLVEWLQQMETVCGL